MVSLTQFANNNNLDDYKKLHEELGFEEYLNRCYSNPKLARNSHQRIYDMITSFGTEEIDKYRKKIVTYKFFENHEEIKVFGIEDQLESLVAHFKGAAGHYGPEKRILLLCGPVGSAKSTICRLIKRNMEDYSKTENGAWYSYKWVNLPTGQNGFYTSDTCECPMNEDPIKLLPLTVRKQVLEELNKIHTDNTDPAQRTTLYSLNVEGEINPKCKFFFDKLLKMYNGDWVKVVNNHIVVVRKQYSEADRVGIASFQPKDEKNQDSTELTGDINFALLPTFGSDSDPRTFNFDGEFCVANRGVIEFIEMLKLETAFLYDLLGASQEKSIKPKKFSQISIDEAIIGHTNIPEYEKLKNNQYMEALKDRTVRIEIPYLLEWSKELKVLEQDYNSNKIKQHIAPHTLQIAALFSVLTRLEDDKDNKITLTEKADLYDGKMLPGWTIDRVREIKDKNPNEGMTGMSARYVQDKISSTLSSRHDYINPFMVLNALKSGLENHSLISNKDLVRKYQNCITLATKKLDDILKNEVQKALVGDEEAIVRLCANYIDNLMAYINKARITNKITGREESPDEKLMRSIESKIDVPESTCDDFRRMIAAFIGDLAVKGKTFRWDSNPLLKKALESKLFEDTKDHIKLSAFSSGATTVDPDVQKKIDAVKQRLVEKYGYNEQSATDVLDYVSSIFARGDLAEDLF
jgi:serine protein kinase